MQQRFRYYDATGKERHTDMPEALADAVQKGQISPTSLIWDSHEGGWVRADEHDATHLAVAARLAMGYDPKADLAQGRSGRGAAARHDSGRRKKLPSGEGAGRRALRRVLTLAVIGAAALVAYELLELIAII
jgi:hypothetical protein